MLGQKPMGVKQAETKSACTWFMKPFHCRSGDKASVRFVAKRLGTDDHLLGSEPIAEVAEPLSGTWAKTWKVTSRFAR